MKTIKFLLVMFFSLAIAACGGGGNSPAGDTTPPTVISVNPFSTATGVALNAAITATFSEAMNASTITSTNFAVSGVPGTVTYSGTTATFTPSANLSPSTPYTATITTGVKDAAGNALASAYVWTFTTGTTADIVPPTVSSTSPANGATDVLENDSITATFSENMNASTVNSANFTVAGVTGTVTYSGTTATFTPSANLAYSTPYTATISTGVKDAAGNAMAATKTWTFTTRPAPDTTPPTVSSTSPANGATGVGPNTLVTATFSENMDAATITNTTFTLNNGVTGTVTYSGATATFTPSANLAYSTAYTATISTAVTDVAGNHMTANKTWTFTTGTQPTYTLSGAITGPWVEGVTITLSGAANATTTTNASGNYSISGLAAGTYTVTPSLAGYTYSPAAPSVTISASNVTQNFAASSAVTTYSVSGNISYAGTKTGDVTFRVYNSTCATIGCNMVANVHFANQGGAFNLPYTIRGLQPGSYVLRGGIGVVNSGYPNVSNPGVTTSFTISSSDVIGHNLPIMDVGTPTPLAPSIQVVAPGNASSLFLYSPPLNAGGVEIATSYKIYWGTDANASTGGGSKTFNAMGRNDTAVLITGLTNGAILYFKMTALVGANESLASTVFGPVTIGAPTGNNTVSGTVTYSGKTPTGPMMVGVYGNSGVVYQLIANPAANLQNYSFAGVPNGTYNSFAVIDMNNNGLVDTGDLSDTNGETLSFAVSGNTTSNLTLGTGNAIVYANTDHRFDTVDSYSVKLGARQGLKRPVAATIFSGPNIGVPYDVGVDPANNSRGYWLNSVIPAVGDIYKYRVTYSDGTKEDLTASVSAVLDTTRMAQNLIAVTNGTGGSSTTAPLVTWSAPSSPLSSFGYRLRLEGNGISLNYPNDGTLPSNTTPLQFLYNGTPLVSGNTYTWQVQVRDGQGNTGTRASTYTVP